MNYIYDILTNFHANLYDFYEWNQADEITHIRKTSLFYVSRQQLVEIINDEVVFESTFLDKIKNKTEVFTNKKIETVEFACLMSDGNEVIAVKLDPLGHITLKSKLLVDEADEITQVCETLEHTPLSYHVTKSGREEPFRTRKELEMKKYILRELKRMENTGDIEKLKYLYFECFVEQQDDQAKILSRLRRELRTNWDRYSHKIYQFFKLTSIHK